MEYRIHKTVHTKKITTWEPYTIIEKGRHINIIGLKTAENGWKPLFKEVKNTPIKLMDITTIMQCHASVSAVRKMGIC